MKNIHVLIITSSLLFTSIFTVNANNWYVEKLLDLNTGLEGYKLSLPELEYITFSNAAVQKTYDEFRDIDTALREEITKQYRVWKISYYQMQDLVNSYSDFIYYTGRTFYYISLEEKGIRGTETQAAIYNGYSKMRSSYVNVTNILK